MKKVLIVRFSQGGTTARVAEAVAAGLRAQGHQVDVHDLMTQPPPPDGYDAIGVGFPVHYYRPPFPVMDYVRNLPDLAGLPTFVFLLHGSHPGDAGTQVRRVLRQKGGREAGYFTSHGADYYFEYVRRGCLFSPDAPTPAELDAARAFGGSLAVNIATGRRLPQADTPPAPLLYRMERFLTNRKLTERIYSRLFHVRADRCTACGLCMKVCPTRNLTPDTQGHPVWGRECLLCLYCEMKCPREAIRSPVSWPLFSPLVALNLFLSRRDPCLECARVIHEKGRTRRREVKP